MLSKEEPVEHTCPLIDRCKDWVWEIKGISEDKDFEAWTICDLEQLVADVNSFDWDAWEATMEEIREANDALRTWGNEWVEEAEKRDDLECERDELLELVRQLEAEKSDLEDELAQRGAE